MRSVSDQSCRENQNTHSMFSNFFFFENHVVYERMWKNTAEPERPQMTWCMRISRWTPKTTKTHTLAYVTIIALLLQQWLHKCTAMLRYTYIACLVPLLEFFFSFWLPMKDGKCMPFSIHVIQNIWVQNR